MVVGWEVLGGDAGREAMDVLLCDMDFWVQVYIIRNRGHHFGVRSWDGVVDRFVGDG